MNNTGFLGIVREGALRTLATEKASAPASLRLTRRTLNDERSPDDDELDLAAYEGLALLVRGVERNGWVYSAVVVEEAGLILSTVVQRVFDMTARDAPYRLPALES